MPTCDISCMLHNQFNLGLENTVHSFDRLNAGLHHHPIRACTVRAYGHGTFAHWDNVDSFLHTVHLVCTPFV